MHKLLTLFEHTIEILFPRTCTGCGRTGSFLCERCISSAPRSEPISNESSSFVTAMFDYRNSAIRQAIWKFKYKNARNLAKCFGRPLYDEIIGDIGSDLRISAEEILLLVPIPLHSKRLRERGYNQSELLSREILSQDTEKILELSTKALTRTRQTKPQAKKERRAARFQNLRGAFTASTELAKGRHLILIDDVTTTGATLIEARKALLRAGARTVRAYVVAH